MKNKVSLKILLVAVFVLLVTMFLIVETYALFESNVSGEKELDVGKWTILLNGNDVVETKTITISDFVYNSGTHTENGYFAPGTSLYFDIEIDATESDVSVQYQLDIDDSILLEHPNIYFNVTDLDNNVTVNASSYSGLIRLSDSNKVDNIRINLVWDDNPEYDESDTELIGSEFEFPITANFIQSIAE